MPEEEKSQQESKRPKAADAATRDKAHTVPTKKELEQMVGELKDRLAGLEQQVKEQQEALDQTTDRMLRALAEVQNTRRRAAEERVRAVALQTDEVLACLLPVLDHLRLAVDTTVAAGADSLADGLQLIVRQMEDVLRAHGAAAVGKVGDKFDPRKHEAVETVFVAGARPGSIVEVLTPGYERQGRILRAAKVRTAAEAPPETPTEPGDSGTANA